MIVTVTGQGYRFVAPVSEVLKEEPPVLELQTVAESIGPLAKRRNRRAFSLAAVLVIAIVASVIWRLPSRRVPLWSTPVPLTRLSGDEIHPAISPDGQRIAFAWNGGTGTSYSIYVKSSDAEDPQRITNSSGQDGSPVWSPDGKQLTFVRFAGDGSGIYLVPSRGGAERRIVCLSSHQGNIHARDLDWSPDGQPWCSTTAGAEVRFSASMHFACRTGRYESLHRRPLNISEMQDRAFLLMDVMSFSFVFRAAT